MLAWGLSVGVLLACILPFGWETLLAAAIYFIPVVCGVMLLAMRRRYRRWDDKLRLCVTVVTRGHLTDLEKIAECLGLDEKGTVEVIE